jgi:hypothetical protein
MNKSENNPKISQTVALQRGAPPQTNYKAIPSTHLTLTRLHPTNHRETSTGDFTACGGEKTTNWSFNPF